MIQQSSTPSLTPRNVTTSSLRSILSLDVTSKHAEACSVWCLKFGLKVIHSSLTRPLSIRLMLGKKWNSKLISMIHFHMTSASFLQCSHATSKFNQHYQASAGCSKKCYWLTSAISKFPLKIFLRMLGFEPWAARWEASMLSTVLCNVPLPR